MSKFQKIDIDVSSNIEKLREKLRLLLEDKSLCMYSEEEERSCYDALEKYIREKYNDSFLDLSDMRKLPQAVQAIILEDMLCFPNRLTEGVLHARDLKMQGLDPSTTVECGSARSNHLISTAEQELLKDYIYIPTIQRLGLGTRGIISSDLVSKFKRTFSRDINEPVTDAQAYAVLAERLEQVVAVLKKFDAISTKDTRLVSGNQSLLDIVLRDAKVNMGSSLRIALFQSPHVLTKRLNFLNFINTAYNAKKKYDASISFESPQQLVNLLLASENRFLNSFDYEISDMMSLLKYKNEETGKKISYSKMEELLVEDPFIRNKFLENNKFYKTMLNSNSALKEALEEGKKAYDAYIKSHKDDEEAIKDEAMAQFRRLFLNSEFGVLTENEKERIQYLSKETIEKSASDKFEEATYTVVDMTPNNKRGSNPLGHLPPVDSTPKRRRSDKYDPLRDPVARDFITNVIDEDISYEGVIGTNVGTKVAGRDKVYYFVFATGENGRYKILEPIGQPHNATFVFRTEKNVRELAEILSKKKICLDRFVENKEAIRIYHSTKHGELNDCPNRLRLIAEALMGPRKEETSEKADETDFSDYSAQALSRRMLKTAISNSPITLEDLTNFSTQRVNTSELPDVKAYIARLYRATDERKRRNIAKKVGNITKSGRRA